MDLFQRGRARGLTITGALTWLVYGLAVLFADVMYIQLVWAVVEAPLFRILAIGGAFALGLSVLMLPRKLRNGDIADGQQRMVAIGVLIAEFGLMVANVVVAFATAAGDAAPDDPLLALYAAYVAPATPVLVAGGFLLIWLADPIDLAARRSREAATEEQLLRLDLRTHARQAALDAVRRNLDDPRYRAALDAEARLMTADIFREAFGAGVSAGDQGLAPLLAPPVPPRATTPEAPAEAVPPRPSFADLLPHTETITTPDYDGPPPPHLSLSSAPLRARNADVPPATNGAASPNPPRR